MVMRVMVMVVSVWPGRLRSDQAELECSRKLLCSVEERRGEEGRFSEINNDSRGPVLGWLLRSLSSVSFGGKNTQSVLFPLLCKVRAEAGQSSPAPALYLPLSFTLLLLFPS